MANRGRKDRLPRKLKKRIKKGNTALKAVWQSEISTALNARFPLAEAFRA